MKACSEGGVGAEIGTECSNQEIGRDRHRGPVDGYDRILEEESGDVGERIEEGQVVGILAPAEFLKLEIPIPATENRRTSASTNPWPETGSARCFIHSEERRKTAMSRTLAPFTAAVPQSRPVAVVKPAGRRTHSAARGTAERAWQGQAQAVQSLSSHRRYQPRKRPTGDERRHAPERMTAFQP